MSGYDFGAKIRNSRKKLPYGLNHGRQLLKKSLGKTANDKEANRYIERFENRPKIPSQRLGRRTTLSTLRTSNLCSRHKTMSSLLSAHYLITTKSWRRKISVPVHCSAITSQKKTPAQLYTYQIPCL